VPHRVQGDPARAVTPPCRRARARRRDLGRLARGTADHQGRPGVRAHGRMHPRPALLASKAASRLRPGPLGARDDAAPGDRADGGPGVVDAPDLQRGGRAGGHRGQWSAVRAHGLRPDPRDAAVRAPRDARRRAPPPLATRLGEVVRRQVARDEPRVDQLALRHALHAVVAAPARRPGGPRRRGLDDRQHRPGPAHTRGRVLRRGHGERGQRDLLQRSRRLPGDHGGNPVVRRERGLRPLRDPPG